MKIVEIEAHLIQIIKTHFDGRLKSVDSLPADFDSAAFERFLISIPAVFVSFSFGPAVVNMPSATIQGRWAFMAVSGNAGGEKQRRHGSHVEIGAYEIMERIIPLLHKYTIEDVGTLTFADSDNLYSELLDKKGASAYAAIFTLPMSFDSTLITDVNSLNDFLTFESDIDLAPADGQTEAHDKVTLEQ